MPDHLGRQAPPRRTLDRIYPMPNENKTIDDWHRLRNQDLASFDELDLDREFVRVTHRMAFEPDRYRLEWLMARRAAVRTEQRRRRGAPEPAAGRAGWSPLPVRGGGRRGR